MGIFAKGSRFPANVEADTPQNRYGGQLTKDSVAGDALGETIGNVNATADSANTTTGEIIKDIEALEGRVDSIETNGAPPAAHKHVSSDITDSTLYADSTAGIAHRLVRTGIDGFLYSRDNPTRSDALARKGYVDAVTANVSNTINDRIEALEGRVSTLEGQLAGAISRIEALENTP